MVLCVNYNMKAEKKIVHSLITLMPVSFTQVNIHQPNEGYYQASKKNNEKALPE